MESRSTDLIKVKIWEAHKVIDGTQYKYDTQEFYDQLLGRVHEKPLDFNKQKSDHWLLCIEMAQMSPILSEQSPGKMV